MNPSGRATRFHDHQVEGVLFAYGGQVIAIGGGEEEFVMPRFCVNKAAHCLESAEVQGGDLPRYSFLRDRVDFCDSLKLGQHIR